MRCSFFSANLIERSLSMGRCHQQHGYVWVMAQLLHLISCRVTCNSVELIFKKKKKNLYRLFAYLSLSLFFNYTIIIYQEGQQEAARPPDTGSLLPNLTAPKKVIRKQPQWGIESLGSPSHVTATGGEGRTTYNLLFSLLNKYICLSPPFKTSPRSHAI